jgi:signal peptidase I
VIRRLIGPMLSFSLALALTACDGDDGGGGSTFKVEGAGMSPTFVNGQTVGVQPYASGVAPAVGDIVIFRAPSAPHREFIKRIIGLPGDTIEIRDGSVLVNGEPLDEPYAAGPTNCSSPQCRWVAADGFTGPAEVYCPRDCYFVLGDNRPNSSDSRQGWLVPRENIIGYVNPAD